VAATQAVPVLRAAIGTYPHTRALKAGQTGSARLRLEFAEVAPISRAFAPMVREGRFDVSEMAIATFLQAEAYGKPLVLLPVVLVARFQEAALLCRANCDLRGPADLAGMRVGVRAYSQTTGMWLRGILADDYGIRPERMRWITFEDAHVAEYRDPPFAERARPGQELLAMLRAGEIDAAIVGNDVPDDPALRTVFPDPAAAGEAFFRRHGFVPVNHLLVVSRTLAERRGELVAELVRMVAASWEAAPGPAGTGISDRAALAPALALALRYAGEQGLLRRRVESDELWEGAP